MKNKISIIIGALLTLGLAGTAQAINVDGDFGLSNVLCLVHSTTLKA